MSTIILFLIPLYVFSIPYNQRPSLIEKGVKTSDSISTTYCYDKYIALAQAYPSSVQFYDPNKLNLNHTFNIGPATNNSEFITLDIHEDQYYFLLKIFSSKTNSYINLIHQAMIASTGSNSYREIIINNTLNIIDFQVTKTQILILDIGSSKIHQVNRNTQTQIVSISTFIADGSQIDVCEVNISYFLL